MLSLTRPTASCGLRDFLLASLLHGAHVEIEHALTLVALFLVLLSKLDDLFEDFDVKSVALGLRKYFLLLLVQLLDLGIQIFDSLDERADLTAGNGDVRAGLANLNRTLSGVSA